MSLALGTGLFLASALGPDIAVAAEPKPTPAQLEFFEKNVRPILVSHCYTCHSADTQPSGELRVDTGNGILAGGESGPAVVPGHPEKSLLLLKVSLANPKYRMPKESEPLTAEEIAKLTTWIRDGAAWPDETEKLPATNAGLAKTYERLKSNHWAWQPLADPKVPTVSNTSWPAGEIDRFILAKLEEKKMTPVGDADPITLIRRVTYDLTGLPPTPAEVDAFRKDHSDRAYARLVDRLLQSPQYGERWGRHWLDVARYGESTGPSRNIPYPHAWRYRDYVIDAVNRDVPFDRFVQEQIAGDLLSATSSAERDRLAIATGFLALGPKDTNQRFKERFVMDNVDDQIDTVSRSLLAMTVSCARCHDHKFDPIPTTDYYALAGIFTSTDDAIGLRSKMGGDGLDYYDPKMLLTLATFPALPPVQVEKVEKLKGEIAAAKKELDDIDGTADALVKGPDGTTKEDAIGIRYENLREELVNLTDPGTHGYGIHGVREGHIADTAVRVRGVEERHGPIVPRGVLTAFTVPGAPAVDPGHSGRLELAQWLTSPANPLTARVFVNRVWQHLFGQGIVSTVDNFGVTGDQPSNPELLDYLAAQFIRDGWSAKALIRTIVSSRAYRLGSEAREGYAEIDPANKLVWRHFPRRLEAEEIRDSMLASAGRLRLDPPAGSPAMKLMMIEIPDSGKVARTIQEEASRSVYRSIYLPLLRGVTPESLAAFDPVTQSLVTGQRDTTTVPTQALYMLNSGFVRRQALSLAEKLLSEPDRNTDNRVREAYQLILCRFPEKQEVAQAGKFLAEYEESYRKLPPVEPSAPLKPAPANDTKPATGDDAQASPAIVEEPVQAKSPQAAAWMGLVQALYASAEFQFVR